MIVGKKILKELETNAKRTRGINLDPKRQDQITNLRQSWQKKTGGGRKPRKWTESEITYLQENYKTKQVIEMALDLERSWNSVEHKLSRLKLRKYNKWI